MPDNQAPPTDDDTVQDELRKGLSLERQEKVRKSPVSITPEIKELFLTYLAKTHRVQQSAFAAGVHPKTVYMESKRDPEFAERIEAAKQSYLDSLEELIDTRARSSDRILELLAKRHIPAYRDKMNITQNTTVKGGPLNSSMEDALRKLNKEERAAIRGILEGAAAREAQAIEGPVDQGPLIVNQGAKEGADGSGT